MAFSPPPPRWFSTAAKKKPVHLGRTLTEEGRFTDKRRRRLLRHKEIFLRPTIDSSASPPENQKKKTAQKPRRAELIRWKDESELAHGGL